MRHRCVPGDVSSYAVIELLEPIADYRGLVKGRFRYPRMKATDINRLSKPFPPEADADLEARLALGMVLPNLRDLEQAIFDDLQDSSPYGISWWERMLEPADRILTSDHLYACTQAVSTNLCEASLHRLEFVDWRDRENDLISIGVQHGEPRPNPPRRGNALEVLTSHMTDLHIVGLTRALSSALDCLAGTIIGIVALPSSILRASFGSMREMVIECTEERCGGPNQGRENPSVLFGKARRSDW